jgi:hypothetical protein
MIRFSKKQGGTLVLVAVFMTALMAFASLSIDLGNVLTQRRYIHEATDAAAIAAVPDWARGFGAQTVVQVGTVFGQTNGLAATEILSITPGSWNASSSVFTPANPVFGTNSVPAVRVVAQRNVNTPFLRVLTLGAQTTMSPKVESIAVVARATSVSRAAPWAVCDTFTPVRCMQFTLQFKNGGETNACSSSGPLQGNFGALDLSKGGNTGREFRDVIAEGYNGVLRVGQTVQTKTGVSAGQVRDGLNTRIAGAPPYDCTATSAPPNNGRLAVIPVVHSLDLNGAKNVPIMKFYVMVIDDYSNNGKTVTARFLDTYIGQEVDPSAPPSPGELGGIGLVK